MIIQNHLKSSKTISYSSLNIEGGFGLLKYIIYYL
jgi:hypothetical protein